MRKLKIRFLSGKLESKYSDFLTILVCRFRKTLEGTVPFNNESKAIQDEDSVLEIKTRAQENVTIDEDCQCAEEAPEEICMQISCPLKDHKIRFKILCDKFNKAL